MKTGFKRNFRTYRVFLALEFLVEYVVRFLMQLSIIIRFLA